MQIKSVTEGTSLRNAFGAALVALKPQYEFEVIDCDVAGGTGLSAYRDKYPVIQAGIAEQAAVGIGVGLALTNPQQRVFVSTFAAFGARAWEIYRLSVAYNRANVCLVLSHVGLDVGPDGASAQSLEHYDLWPSIPGVRVYHPGTPQQMLTTVRHILDVPGPCVLFTGRSSHDFGDLDVLPVVTDGPSLAQQVRAGVANRSILLFVTCGNTLGITAAAAKKLAGQTAFACDVFNAISLKPLAVDRLIDAALLVDGVVVVEDAGGGLFRLVAEALAEVRTPLKSIRVEGWGESGEQPELWERHGLTDRAIAETAYRWWREL